MKKSHIFLIITILLSSCGPDFYKGEPQYINLVVNNIYDYDSVVDNHEFIINVELLKKNGANLERFLFIQNNDTIDYTHLFVNKDIAKIIFKPELNNLEDTFIYYILIAKPLNFDIKTYYRFSLKIKPDTLI